MNQKSLDKKKTKELDWKIELYTLLNKHADKKDFYWTQLGEDLTKLISSLLQKQRTELLEEIKKIINEELLVCPYCFNRIKDYECTACDHYDGYSVEKRIEQINENINLLNKKDEQI